MEQHYDTIVVGLGAMGAASTYQLAKRGRKVLGIDRYDPPHRFGSTHGETRITRIACGEGEIYTRFARRSHEIWREIEEELGLTGDQRLLVQNGLIVIAGRDPSSGHEIPHFLETTAENARRADIPFEMLDSAQIMARYPAFAVKDSDRAYLDRVGGFVRPEACIDAQLALARKHGADTNTGEIVERFEQIGSQVRVTTTAATYVADTLIVTAGPWLPDFLEEPEASLFRVTRQVLYWFAIRSDDLLARFKPNSFPVFIWLVPRPQAVYGFPALGGSRDGVKIATEQTVLTTTPTEVDRNVTDEETREMYDTYVRPFFPDLTGESIRAEACLYTEVERARFIIDRLPGSENVIVASPCSGHGFKHSAAVGELLAQMATGEPHLDIGAFRFHPPDRPRSVVRPNQSSGS